jgi:hypothetical protein
MDGASQEENADHLQLILLAKKTVNELQLIVLAEQMI